jgi:hypothetical protein
MVLLRGQSRDGALTCESRTVPVNCAIVTPVGLHSAMAQLVFVANGRIIDSSAFVVAETPQLVAADLNGDGILDLSARDSDYRPNFAEGHLFDRTYRYDVSQHRFHSTGCSGRLANPRTAAPPAVLETGPCPPK